MRSAVFVQPAPLVAIVFCLLAARPLTQPQVMQVAGHELRRASQATRSEMIGLVDLYQVSLYAPPEVSTLAALRKTQAPKALHVDVKYDGSLPDNIPSDWTRELEPALSRTQQEKLRRAYASLRSGDTIRIVYAPGEGTTLAVSGRPVLTDRGHDLMAAFLDIWLGQTPVSEDLKETLVKGL